MNTAQDEAYMRIALEEARVAFKAGETPVGAVIVLEGAVLARAHNMRESQSDPTAHAEITALREAAAQVGSWRLCGATVYCTLEPCCMCAGAMVNARIERVVYGAADAKSGGCGSVVNILEMKALNHCVRSTGGVLADEGLRLLRDFFRERRT